MKINWNGLATFPTGKCQSGIRELPCKHRAGYSIRKEFLDLRRSIEVCLKCPMTTQLELFFLLDLLRCLMLINETNISSLRGVEKIITEQSSAF